MLVLFSVSTYFVMTEETGNGHAALEAIVFYFRMGDKQETVV